MESPDAIASSSRFRTTTAQPDPNIVPCASSSNARQCPSAEANPPSWNAYARFCGNVIETPPANAASQCPPNKLSQACVTAMSEVEQAVPMVMIGPVKFSLYDTRVERKSGLVPNIVW